MYNHVGPEKTKGILFFHAFTGCDTVSAFHNKGKKTAWQTWDVFPEASPIFAKLSQYPSILDDVDLEILERFVVLMYDTSSTVASVDEVRFDMFARKQRPYEALSSNKSSSASTR